MIIHINGSSGSGKTTIGNKIKKIFGNKVAVFDVDDLHMNPLTRPKYWNELNKTKTITEAKKVWKKLIHKTISETIKKNSDKIIIFVGLIEISLPSKYKKCIYEIPAVNYKFFLEVPINLLIERYYTRLCYYEKIGTKKQNEIYWQNVGLNKQYILGSQDIIDINNENIKHAEKYNYKIMDSENIIKILEKIL